MSPASTSRQTEVRVRRAPGNHRSRRSWIAAGVSLGLLIGLIVLGISKLDPAAVAGSLTSIDASWVLLAVTLMGGSFLARAESWFIALRAAAPDAPVGRSAVRRALLIGMATSTVAPGRLGEAARAWIIARRIGDQREVIATVAGTVLFQTLLNLFALTILAVIALSDPAITHASIAGLMVALALPVSLVSVLLVAPKALGRAARSHHLWLRAAAEWLARQLVNARRGLAAFRQARAAAHTTIAQLTGWTLQLGTCYALVLALHLGGKANLAAAAAVLVAVNLTAIVPLTPSNVVASRRRASRLWHRLASRRARGLPTASSCRRWRSSAPSRSERPRSCERDSRGACCAVNWRRSPRRQRSKHPISRPARVTRRRSNPGLFGRPVRSPQGANRCLRAVPERPRPDIAHCGCSRNNPAGCG